MLAVSVLFPLNRPEYMLKWDGQTPDRRITLTASCSQHVMTITLDVWRGAACHCNS